MTDSASWRRRRRGGRHQEPVRRSTSSPTTPGPADGTPASAPDPTPSADAPGTSEDTARRRRDEAFGATRRAWPAAQDAAVQDPAPAPRGRRARRLDPPAGEVEQDAWTPPPAAAAPTAAASSPPASPSPPSPRSSARRRADSHRGSLHDRQVFPGSAPATPSPAAPAPSTPAEPVPVGAAATDTGDAPTGKAPLARRPETPPPGSLRTVALWTLLGSVLPGAGLVTTKLRRVGIVLLGVLVLAVVVVGGWLLLGDPIRDGAMLATRRGVLVSLFVLTILTGLVWTVQIVLTGLGQSARERLETSRRRIAMGLAAVMVVTVAVPFARGAQSIWAFQNLLGSETVFGPVGDDTPDIQEGPDPWAGVGRINIMLLGQDQGDDREGTRPDTLMVASVDTETGRTALFSIPRNLEHVRFPEGTAAAEVFPDGFDYFGRNQDLINAVWTWAEDRPDLFEGDPSPGLTATRWAFEETLGLKMDYYAMVNLQGFEDMVDAIGGVDMVVERRIPIGGGTNQATGGKYPIDGYIEPGLQKLDGFHALWYARSREGSDDFDRMCRQQRMVRVVSEEADPATLALSIPRLVVATEENIETNLPVQDLDAFVELALRVKDAGFVSYPITQDVTPSYNPDWDYLKAWTQASIEDSMEQEGVESVAGTTEPDSTEPAPTGPAPDEETDEAGTGTEETSSDPTDAPTDEATGEEDATEEEGDAPVIDQDPLKSCLPGGDTEG